MTETLNDTFTDTLKTLEYMTELYHRQLHTLINTLNQNLENYVNDKLIELILSISKNYNISYKELYNKNIKKKKNNKTKKNNL